jgi:hypothetical protein
VSWGGEGGICELSESASGQTVDALPMLPSFYSQKQNPFGDLPTIFIEVFTSNCSNSPASYEQTDPTFLPQFVSTHIHIYIYFNAMNSVHFCSTTFTSN